MKNTRRFVPFVQFFFLCRWPTRNGPKGISITASRLYYSHQPRAILLTSELQISFFSEHYYWRGSLLVQRRRRPTWASRYFCSINSWCAILAKLENQTWKEQPRYWCLIIGCTTSDKKKKRNHHECHLFSLALTLISSLMCIVLLWPSTKEKPLH